MTLHHCLRNHVSVYTFGSNSHGQLGTTPARDLDAQPKHNIYFEPQFVALPDDVDAITVTHLACLPEPLIASGCYHDF